MCQKRQSAIMKNPVTAGRLLEKYPACSEFLKSSISPHGLFCFLVLCDNPFEALCILKHLNVACRRSQANRYQKPVPMPHI